MKKIGIGLGIRSQLETIKKAAIISDKSNKIDYFFVPEIHPKYVGVDAFETLKNIMGDVQKIRLGTGIVNVFARSEQDTLKLAKEIFYGTKENFVLGLGTSTPSIVENMYKTKFEKPLTRLLDYTTYLKKKYPGPIIWGAVGDKTIRLAVKHIDGILFLLKTEEEMKRSIEIVKTELESLEKSLEEFEIIVIRPTILEDSMEKAKMVARISLASYVAGSQFYAKPLSKLGFKKEVYEICNSFEQEGLEAAAEKVSEKMIMELFSLGGVEDCARDLNEYSKRIQANCIVAGFMGVHSNDSKNINFLKNLEGLIAQL